MAATKPSDLDDQNLWVDPLRDDPRIRSGAVLLADVIKEYVKLNLLINKEEFQFGKLKGASYTMFPHPSDAWIIRSSPNEDGADQESRLEPQSDSRGQHYLIPKNSLVFIRLRPQLRVPFYIIGRHNLKIRYVYKGLLLGTGPQVDPGYVGNLIIPLHNLTTKDTKIYINESFVSIDFVRTTPMFSRGEIPPNSFKELYEQFGESKHLLDTHKVLQRTALLDYLEESTPRSQLAEFQRKIDGWKQVLEQADRRQENQKREISDLARDVRKWSRIEYIAITAVLLTLLGCYATLIYRFDAKFSEVQGAVNSKVFEVGNDLITTSNIIQGLSNRFILTSQAQSAMISNLEAQVKRMQIDLSGLAISRQTNSGRNP